MDVLGHMARRGHGQTVFCPGAQANLNTIITIHDIAVGPALGGAGWNPSLIMSC